MEHILPRPNKKVSLQERFLYGLTGGALLALGIRRGSFLGGSVAVVGADLLTRGATGHHIHEALGVVNGRAGRRGASRIPHQLGVQIQKSILVTASPEKAYEFVRNFENLPRFMNHLKNVYATSDNRSHWVVSGPAGAHVEWDAEIINDIPGQLIAWRSVNNPDVDSAGSVKFEKAPQDRGTIIRVHLQYLPPAGSLGAVIAKLFGEEPEQQLTSDLRRLKQILETGEIASTEGQPVGGFQAFGRRERRVAREQRGAVPVRETSEPAGLLPEGRRAAAAGRAR